MDISLEEVKSKLADGSIHPFWGPKASELTEDERAQVILDAILGAVEVDNFE